jgi:putative nucleotidyltransferase with HDIG domain
MSALSDTPRRRSERHLPGHLPLVLVATAAVTAAPVAVAAAIVPSARGGGLAGSVVLAVALSILVAGVGSALWKRHPRAHELVFADLMLWGWLYRLWIERRLGRAARRVTEHHGPSATARVLALERLGRLLESRDAYTHGHSQRVTRHVAAIVRTMHLAPAEVTLCLTAAALHDIGKLHTPREILNKPGRLTDEEFAVIKRHPDDGVEMLREIDDQAIRAMVRHHHERIDGSGYPDGLRGDEIPVGARIIAVADTFDAMTCNRAYRRAGSHKRALDVLHEEAGRQFDPEVVAAFASHYSARRSVAGAALVVAAAHRLWAALAASTSTVGGASNALPTAGLALLIATSAGPPPATVGHARADAGAPPPALAAVAVTRPVTLAAGTHGHRKAAVSPSAPRHRPARRHRPKRSAGHHEPRPGSGSAGGSAPGGSAPGESAPPGTSLPDSTSGAPPASPSTPAPPPAAPTTRTPAASVGPVATPPVTVPGVHTPPIAVASVTVSAVSTPPVTVPAVTVPAVTVPSRPLP